MKTKITLFILIIFSGITYVIVDHYLYYYGRNELNIYNELITKIKPEYWDLSGSHNNEGFVLLDDGMTCIAKGNIFRGYAKIEVDSVLSYGFNDSVLVGLILTKDKESYYVVINKSSYKVTLLSYKNYRINEIVKLFNLKKWIYNVNNPPVLLFRIRAGAFLVIIFSFILFFINLSKRR